MKITKKSLIAQVKGLTKQQCKQLGVDNPFPADAPEEGAEAMAALEAWLEGGVLTDEEGNPIDLESMFGDSDSFELTINRAAADEEIPIGDAIDSTVDAVRGIVRQQVGGQKTVGNKTMTRVTSGSLRKRTKNFESDEAQYRAGKWLAASIWQIPSAQKWCDNNSMLWGRKSHVGSTDAVGGYTVPDLMADAVLWVRDLYGIAPRVLRHMTMDSDTLNVPKRDAGLTVYYPDQSAAITESTKTFGTAQLVAAKRAVLCAYSSEMGEDSIISIADDLAEEVGSAMGLRMDVEMWQADGTSAYGSVTGLNDSLGAAGKVTQGSGNTWGAITLADLNGVVATLPEKHHPDARWICSRSFKSSVIDKLVYAAGGNTLTQLAGDSGSQLFGYPIELTDAAPTSTAVATTSMMFGNFNNAMLLGDKREVKIDTSEHYSFNLDEITVRGTSRYDMTVVDGGDGSTAGSYVGLVTGA